MTERVLPLADGASACPFVAFEDDRDERATVPDHRHRCYAEPQPAPRALAHQEAYCLSSAFPVCPIFQDWARREAARARADTARSEAAATAAAAGAAAAGAAAAAGMGGAAADSLAAPRTAADDDPEAGAPSPESSDRASDEVIHRNPPRNWSAPPPWLASRDQPRDDADPPPFLGRRAAEPGQGLAGSPADRLAGGPPDREEEDDDRGGWSSSGDPATPGAGAARRSRPPIDEDEPEIEDEEPRRPVRRPRAYDQHLGGTAGPDWERPRRQEAYPMIRSRVGLPNVSRIAGLAILVGLLAVGLFFLPGILGFGSPSDPGGAVRPSGSSVAVPSVSIAPTRAPAPTPRIYTIKKGDSLSKIAAANGITIEELMAANPTIKDPNRIAEGQEITLPAPSEPPPDEIGQSAAPAP